MTQTISIHKKATFTGHSGSIYTLAQYGETGLLSGSGDGSVALWDIANPGEGEMMARIPGVIYSLLCVEEKLLVGQANGGIHVIHLKEKREERLLQYHESGIFNLLHVASHKLIFSLAGDGMLGVLDAGSLTLQHKLTLGTSKLRAAAVNPDNNIIAVGTGDGSIYTFSIPELKPVKHWQAHDEGFSVNAVRFSPDGKFLLSGSRDARLNVFDVENNFALVQSIAAHNYAIYGIEYSNDGTLFATGSRDKTVKIWDGDTFEILKRIDREKNEGHANSVNKIMWLREWETHNPKLGGVESGVPGQRGGCLISASDDRSVMVWDVLG